MPRKGAIVAVLALTGLASSFMFTLVVPIQAELPELLGASREDTAWVVTVTLLVMGNTHVPVPLHVPPPQPVKTKPELGVAVRVTPAL